MSDEHIFVVDAHVNLIFFKEIFFPTFSWFLKFVLFLFL